MNAIPDDVRLESFVRGASVEDMVDANRKVNRAPAASAAALGANVRLEDIPGYMPGKNDLELMEVTREAMELAGVKVDFRAEGWGTGSTDMGDIASVMPFIHPYMGGAVGKSHGNDYYIADPESACVTSAKVQLNMLSLLLGNGAERAKKVIAEYKPVFASKEAYFEAMENLRLDCTAVAYESDGQARLTFGK